MLPRTAKRILELGKKYQNFSDKCTKGQRIEINIVWDSLSGNSCFHDALLHLSRGYRIFDNGGKTADRYTVVFLETINNGECELVTFSENPLSPVGVWVHGIGDFKRKDKEVEVTINDLPEMCQTLIKAELSDYVIANKRLGIKQDAFKFHDNKLYCKYFTLWYVVAAVFTDEYSANAYMEETPNTSVLLVNYDCIVVVNNSDKGIKV